MKRYFQFRASARRIFSGLTGPVLLGLGLGISISAGFGSFGFSVLLDGLYQTFSIPLWLSQTIMTLCFYSIAWHWARIPLGVGSLPTLLLIGPAISIGATFTPADYFFAGNLAAFFIGLLVFSFGISLSAAAALGPDGVTALSLAAEKKKGWTIPKATFIWEICAIFTGTSLGGNLGAATVAGLFGVPILIHWMLPWVRIAMNTQPFLATDG